MKNFAIYKHYRGRRARLHMGFIQAETKEVALKLAKEKFPTTHTLKVGEEMTAIEAVRKAKQDFRNEFKPAFDAIGNNLAVGIGRDEVTGEYAIAVALTNDRLKDILPSIYQGIKVGVEVIGTISAL